MLHLYICIFSSAATVLGKCHDRLSLAASGDRQTNTHWLITQRTKLECEKGGEEAPNRRILSRANCCAGSTKKEKKKKMMRCNMNTAKSCQHQFPVNCKLVEQLERKINKKAGATLPGELQLQLQLGFCCCGDCESIWRQRQPLSMAAQLFLLLLVTTQSLSEDVASTRVSPFILHHFTRLLFPFCSLSLSLYPFLSLSLSSFSVIRVHLCLSTLFFPTNFPLLSCH